MTRLATMLLTAGIALPSSLAAQGNDFPQPPPPSLEAPDGAPRWEDKDEPRYAAAITISPIHLLFPILEMQVEISILQQLGVSAIFGYGNYTAKAEVPGNDLELKFKVIEVGAQIAYYAVGTIDHGMQVGLELMYVNLELVEGDDVRIDSAFGAGTAIGPFLGYKLTTTAGFALHAQLGILITAIHAEAESSSGETDETDETDMKTLLNINIGWAF